MITLLHEPQLIQDMHREYLNLVNTYQNSMRTALFVKYYNINMLNSTHLEETNSTYDIYSYSDIKFDIYDLVPMYNIQGISNRSTPISDLRGQMMDGTTTVISYTITKPLIHDLLVFYPPIGSNEIFRVVNINTPVNAIHSNPNVYHYELELEYAPIKNIDQLKINNHFIYDLSNEKYMTYDQYKIYMDYLSMISDKSKDIYKYYDNILDLYRVNNLVPCVINELAIFIKRKFNTKYKRLFEKFNLPYGYKDKINDLLYTQTSLPYTDLTNNTYKMFDLDTNSIIDYQWRYKDPPFSTEIDKLLYDGYQLYLEINNGQY